MRTPQLKRVEAGAFAEVNPTRGKIVGWEPGKGILVELGAAPTEIVIAATIVQLTEQELNQAAMERRSVLVMFEDGDRRKPVVVGLLAPVPAPARPSQSGSSGEQALTGETIIVRGRDAIELRCGDASITLRSDGRILIRGTNVLSRATEQNRVAGGSVHFN